MPTSTRRVTLPCKYFRAEVSIEDVGIIVGCADSGTTMPLVTLPRPRSWCWAFLSAP
jgi:hypothetical protein